MLDIGWPELLVVAIVLIIVVGPKDLPPMLRAFGRTTKKLRGMASEFRGQFDEALREAELDDVKKTFDDARKLNPMQSIRDAVNPLKDTANSIRSDIEKTVNSPSEKPAWQAKTEIPDATMKLPDGPPVVKSAEPAAAATKTEARAAPKSPASKTGGKAGKPAASKAAASKPSASKAAASKTAAPKTAPAKTASVASAAKAPAKPKAAPAAKSKAAASSTKAPAKAAPRARKSKQGEGQA